MIYLYLKIPEYFIRLILEDGLGFAPVSSASMVEFQFLAQFPVDHFPHPVVSSFKFLFELVCYICFISFSQQRKLMSFHWSLSDNSPQVTRILLSILAVWQNFETNISSFVKWTGMISISECFSILKLIDITRLIVIMLNSTQVLGVFLTCFIIERSGVLCSKNTFCFVQILFFK